MRALLQRVTEAQVAVDGVVIGQCGPGLMILVCAMQGDTDDKPGQLAAKISKLRIFKDEAGKMNRSVQDVGGGLLIVSQFTLAADTRKGLRPGFSTAAAPAVAQPLFDSLVERARALHPQVACGRFGANMQVALINDGPVTFLLDSGEANK